MRYLGLIIILFVVSGCSTSHELQPFDPTRPKAHHTQDGFRNLYLDDTQKAGFFDFLFKVRLQSNWPDENALAKMPPTPRVSVDIASITSPPDNDLQVTWIGHSTLLIQFDGINILTDPMFSERASPFSFAGPKRYTAPALSIDQLPDIDAVIISHNHYDHMDLATIQAIGNKTKWLVPLGNARLLQEVGITNVIELDWWEKIDFKGMVLTLTPTQHWSARGLFDRFATLWGSWAVQFPAQNRSFWFGGDTGYNDIQFKQIGEKFGPFDLSFIPIGAYAPRWFMKGSHVDPEEAVLIHQDIKSEQSIGIHWGTFVLTSEPVEEPPIALKKALKKAGIPQNSFLALPIGETYRKSEENAVLAGQ
ncbi:MBL fold metallo-hydrolase [Sneathiella sp.]|jgi:N-acyl-phosphatidylethanolamine-hydrolysing phospholipase D|uniref:MBL fold metallo-hydrolase n=1 Tax=Sneathiella sp. TaxID=1964365 RepID=UPI0039E2D47D